MVSPVFYSLFGRFDARRPPCADEKAGKPDKDAARPRSQVKLRQAARFETQPTRAHQARAWAAKPTGVETSKASTRPGCRRGDSLSRGVRTRAHARVRPPAFGSLSRQRAKFKPPSTLPRAEARPDLRAMNPSELNTHAAPQWRTTHARVLRARRRLRQLHRRLRHAKLSRNG